MHLFFWPMMIFVYSNSKLTGYISLNGNISAFKQDLKQSQNTPMALTYNSCYLGTVCVSRHMVFKQVSHCSAISPVLQWFNDHEKNTNIFFPVFHKTGYNQNQKQRPAQNPSRSWTPPASHPGAAHPNGGGHQSLQRVTKSSPPRLNPNHTKNRQRMKLKVRTSLKFNTVWFLMIV